MKLSFSLLIVAAIGAGIVSQTVMLRGQPSDRQLLGKDQIWQGWVGVGGQVTDTVNLTFQAEGRSQIVTVEFRTSYAPDRPLPAPGVIDMVITEHPMDDSAPEISAQRSGRSSIVATRRHSRRSISTSMSIEELVQLASADAIIAHPFGDELRFSSEQAASLNAAARDWAARLRQ
jgi:hypothetical protein